MKAARSHVAATAALAAGATLAVVLVVPERARSADPLRERAETLARDASERFSEGMKGGPAAPTAAAPPSGPDDPWSAALKWIDRSNQEYKTILQRLSQAGSIAQAQPTP